MEVRSTNLAKGELKSPQVEPYIDKQRISGCLVDSRATLNVMSNWLLDDLDLQVTKSTSLKLKVADQRCIKSLGLITKVLVTINGITVDVDFSCFKHIQDLGSLSLNLGEAVAKGKNSSELLEDQ